MADLTKKFCLAPFRKFETLIDGTVAPCCSLWIDRRLGHLDSQGLDEIWNGPAAQEIRQSIHDGSFRYCRHDRCSYLIHDTLPDRDSIDDPYYRQIIETGATEMSRGPDWLFLAHDVTCNLSCPSCRSGLLVADAAQEKRLEAIQETILNPALTSGDPVELSLSGQGDPWSSPHYRSILRLLADNELNVRLNLHTNGLLMTPARWQEYAGLARYRPTVNVSIDACRPWTFRVIRRNGEWARLEENLEFMAGLKRAGEISELYLNATIQLDNYHELADMVRLGRRLGCDGVRFFLIQNTGSHLKHLFHAMNVADHRHPLYAAFLETLRDPTFDDPICQMYDVDVLRERARTTTLPSDDVGAPASADACIEAVAGLLDAGSLPEAAAVAACGRAHWPDSRALMLLDGMALQMAGFARLATHRFRELVALDASEPSYHMTLGTTLFELGECEEGARCLITACLVAPDHPEVQDAVAKFFAHAVGPGPLGHHPVHQASPAPLTARAA